MDFDELGDTLINYEAVEQARVKYLHESMNTYKQAILLLGYFSQLREYGTEFEDLKTKIMQYRKEILQQYKDILEQHQDIYKSLLIPPIMSRWFIDGIKKFKHIKKYSIHYYKARINALMPEASDSKNMGELINTIIGLDRYYDIYDDTFGIIARDQTKLRHSNKSIQL